MRNRRDGRHNRSHFRSPCSSPRWHSSAIFALNSGVNERRRGFVSVRQSDRWLEFFRLTSIASWASATTWEHGLAANFRGFPGGARTFAEHYKPHSPDPRHDLDMTGYGIVKVLPGAADSFSWEPKAALAEIARISPCSSVAPGCGLL